MVQWQVLGAIRHPQQRQTRRRSRSNVISLLGCWKMPSSEHRQRDTCAPYQMTSSSTSHASEIRQNNAIMINVLFSDGAAVAILTQQELRSLMNRFSQACKDFGLTISLKKTNIMGHDTETLPVIAIDDHEPDVVCQFTYLRSANSVNLSFDTEIDKMIGKAASTVARLTTRVRATQCCK